MESKYTGGGTLWSLGEKAMKIKKGGEDNELNQELAKELLEMSGILVETAENGKEALKLLNTQKVDGIQMQ